MRTLSAKITRTAWAWLLIGGLGNEIGSVLSSSAAEPTVASDADHKRVQSALQGLYDFSSADGSIVQDRSGVGQPLDLRISDPNAVRQTAGGLEVVGQTLIRSEKPATRLIESIRQSGAITIEAWVRAATTNQTGPARIVSLSHNPNERNFTLGQDGDKFEVRLRTTETSTNGIPAVASKAKSVTTELTHVVYTRARGQGTHLHQRQVERRGWEPTDWWGFTAATCRPTRSARIFVLGLERRPGPTRIHWHKRAAT